MKHYMNVELDMDGVCADFLQTYLELGESINLPVKPPYTDNSKNPELFRIAVLEHNIFTNLPLMPGAVELKAYLERLERIYAIKITMLTSLNSYEPDVMEAGRIQKQAWLGHHGFKWEMKCVSANAEKANYAAPNSILIDDNPECVTPFLNAGGQAVLYRGFGRDFLNQFEGCLKNAYDTRLEKAI